ncbi:hypothetical protein PoB_004071900 [Plakobranchus ocellatus]|uniref:Uncharacterized protein n=1 Tax=Plakobranchus ocellatus TaxID=259542 RepID=A0AAV4B6A2_9GAST|nr:hypothetical protein PoB_004071900 [Plakobranchus ocellatus]
MLCLRIIRPRRSARAPDAESNESGTQEEPEENAAVANDGSAIQADSAGEGASGKDGEKKAPEEGKDEASTVSQAQATDTAKDETDAEEGERRREEREALRSLDDALGRDAISEAGESSIIEASEASSPRVEEKDKKELEKPSEKENIKEEKEDKTADKTEDGFPKVPDNVNGTPEDKPLQENGALDNLLNNKNDDEKTIAEFPSSFKPDDKIDNNVQQSSDQPVKKSVRAVDLKDMQVKSDDNSSLGGISVDPQMDTGSGIDGLVPDSPVGIDAIEGAGSDEDSDYPEEAMLPLKKGGDGYRKQTSLLTGKTYNNINTQAMVQSGDIEFRKPVPNHTLVLQGSGKEATPLEMVISSKMAADTQEELVSALEKVRTLRVKVTEVEKDVVEAQTDAYDARKEAIEAKNQAIQAKQEATEAMEEATAAKRDIARKRQDINALYTAPSTLSTTNPQSIELSSLPNTAGNALGINTTSQSAGTEDITSHQSCVGPTSVQPHLRAGELVPDGIDRLARTGSEAITNTTGSVTSAMTQARTLAQDGRAINGRLEGSMQDIRDTGMALKNQTTFVSIWGGFFLRLSVLLVLLGGAGHLVVSFITALNDESYIKLGVFGFILVCIFMPAAVLLIYLLAKSNVSALYKATRELNAAKKSSTSAVNHATVTFSDHVVELPTLNHVDDGMDEISLGSEASRETAPASQPADALRSDGSENPAFQNDMLV